MSIEIRGIDASEAAQVQALDGIVFGYRADVVDGHFELDRALCAFDEGRMVGSSAALSLEVTLPGGARVPMAGITWVGVLNTHHRRGIMRRLMTEQLARLEQTGEPVAGLGASQSLLYRRFGFGPATRAAHVTIETKYARFLDERPCGGTLAHLDAGEGVDTLIALQARIRQARNGMVSRPPEMYRRSYRDAGKEKDGAGPLAFVAHRDGGGDVDGVVAYRMKPEWDTGELYGGDLRIVELLATAEDAAAALWRFCLDHDLVRRVVFGNAPVDDPTSDRLADPRRWVARPRDDLHIRPDDVAALLAARRYGREDGLTVEVQDPLFAHRGGRFRVEGGLDGATCTRVDSTPDITLGSAALGSILLGDAPVERLHRAGLVDEHSPGAVRRATAMFAWSPLPWASHMF